MERKRIAKIRDRTEDAFIGAVESAWDSFVESVTRPKFADAQEVVIGLLDERIESINAKAKPTAADQQQRDYLRLLRVDLLEALDERWNTRKTFGPET